MSGERLRPEDESILKELLRRQASGNPTVPYYATPAELAMALAREAGAVYQGLLRLEHAGLVKRLPTDEQPRASSYHLSPEGEQRAKLERG